MKNDTPKRARIETDGNTNVFVYANGQPGDIAIDARPDELDSWREIIRAVNSHQFLINTLNEIALMLQRGSPTLAMQKIVREALAQAERK